MLPSGDPTCTGAWICFHPATLPTSVPGYASKYIEMFIIGAFEGSTFI
jgi:hypothetical protein